MKHCTDKAASPPTAYVSQNAAVAQQTAKPRPPIQSRFCPISHCSWLCQSEACWEDALQVDLQRLQLLQQLLLLLDLLHLQQTEQLSLKVRGHHTGLNVTPFADDILLRFRIRHLVLLQNFPRRLLLLQLLDGSQFLRIEQENRLQQIRLEGFNLLKFDFQAAEADFIAVPFPLTLFKFLIFLSVSGSPLPLPASDWLWLTGGGAD